MNDVVRCAWLNLSNELYVEYHDKEWGRPVHDDNLHFEMLNLEGAQAGLKWETILAKRQGYRECFAEFIPEKVARFSQKKRESLYQNPKIVRHKGKIDAVVTNAIAFLALQKEYGSFDEYIWGYVDNQSEIIQPKTLEEYPTKTPLSEQISKDLKKRGFKFVGPTIIYAYMQAAGLVIAHSKDCFLNPLKEEWSVYMVRTRQGHLYTGVAKDVSKRFQEHSSQGPKCAKYLRGKGPLKLVFHQVIGNRSKAQSVETALKALSKATKLDIIKHKDVYRYVG